MAGRLLLLLFLLCAATRVGAAPPGVRVGKEPAWVIPTPVDDSVAVPRSHVRESYLLLHEVQSNQVASPAETYFHDATLVVNQQGIPELSRVLCSFDPTYEQLTFHRVVVHRRGTVLNRLVPSRIMLLHREEGLEWDVVSGSRTALLLLDDVQAGDIVETSFTRRGSNPVMAGHFHAEWPTSWTVPVRLNRHRILWPGTRPLTVQSYLGASEPEIRRHDGIVEYNWTVENAPGIELERNLPAWYRPFPAVEVTDFRNWNEVARWGVPLYRAPEPVPAALRGQIETLRRAGSNPEERALAAIRFVQDDVRYLGIELGEGSQRPTPPERVLSRRYGDCKDKSLLLVTLLTGLGFDAQVALVNSAGGPDLSQRTPAPGVFDHAIVRFRTERGVHWVDATQQAERAESFATLDVPDYGHALVLEDSTTTLMSVVAPPKARGGIAIRKEFDVRRLDAPGRLTVVTTFLGREANKRRRELQSETVGDMERAYREFYAHQYPGVETAVQPLVRDDPKANRITITETYRIKDFWPAGARERDRIASFDANELVQTIPSQRDRRTMPLGLGRPGLVTCETRALMPPGWSAPDGERSIHRDWLRFEKRVRTRNGVLEIWDGFEVLRPYVEADQAEETTTTLEEISGELQYASHPGRNVDPGPGRGLSWQGLLVFAVSLTLGVWSARWFARQPFAQPQPENGTVIVSSQGNPGSTAPYSVSEAQPPAPVVPDAAGPDHDRVVPLPGPGKPAIGGWLFLVGTGVVLGPIVRVVRDRAALEMLLRSGWQAQVQYGQMTSHAGHIYVVIFELATTVLSVVWWGALGYAFFQRLRVFPRAWVAVGAMEFLFLVLEYLGLQLTKVDDEAGPRTAVAIAQQLVMLAIWGAYLLTSRRSRHTFVR